MLDVRIYERARQQQQSVCNKNGRFRTATIHQSCGASRDKTQYGFMEIASVHFMSMRWRGILLFSFCCVVKIVWLSERADRERELISMRRSQCFVTKLYRAEE